MRGFLGMNNFKQPLEVVVSADIVPVTVDFEGRIKRLDVETR